MFKFKRNNGSTGVLLNPTEKGKKYSEELKYGLVMSGDMSKNQVR